MVGWAGFPGGACLTIGREAAAGRRVCISRRGSGWPGCAAIACCCLANGTGGGGGVRLAMTCRFATADGGALTCPAEEAFAPSTLSRVGLTATLAATGAAASCCALIATAACATGCAPANACCGTTVTAPCTFRFA